MKKEAKTPDTIVVHFTGKDLEQPFTNGLECALATAAKRTLKAKTVAAGVTILDADGQRYYVLPPFTPELFLKFQTRHTSGTGAFKRGQDPHFSSVKLIKQKKS